MKKKKNPLRPRRRASFEKENILTGFAPANTAGFSRVASFPSLDTGSRVESAEMVSERWKEGRPGKINAPTFAYRAVYGTAPPTYLMGRTAAPKKMWRGMEVDAGLKNSWLKALNDLPVEIRSTEEGKSPDRPAFVIFRLPEEQEQLHKKMVKALRSQGLYSISDIGQGGRPRICAAGKIWKGMPEWETWWNKLPQRITNAYRTITSSKIKAAENIDELFDLTTGDTLGLTTGAWELSKLLPYHPKVVSTKAAMRKTFSGLRGKPRVLVKGEIIPYPEKLWHKRLPASRVKALRQKFGLIPPKVGFVSGRGAKGKPFKKIGFVGNEEIESMIERVVGGGNIYFAVNNILRG